MPDGGYCVGYNLGAAGFESPGPERGYLIRTDSMLVPLWKHESLTGLRSFHVLADGSMFVLRGTSVERYDSNGQPIWSRYFPVFPTNSLEYYGSLSTGHSVIITGAYLPYPNFFGGYDYWHGLRMEVDTAGNLLSSDTLSSAGNSHVSIYAISRNSNGGEAICGLANPDAFISLSSGTNSWTQAFAHNGIAPTIRAVLLLDDNSVIAVGQWAQSMLDPLYNVMFRINPTGTLAWSKFIPNDEGAAVGINLLSNGHFAIQSYHHYANSTTDSLGYLVMEMDTAGNLVHARKFYRKTVSAPYEIGNGTYLFAACNMEPNLFTTDSTLVPACLSVPLITPLSLFPLTTAPLTCNYTAYTLPISAGTAISPGTQFYIDSCSLSPLTLPVPEQASPSLRIFPNPVSDAFRIETKMLAPGAVLEVWDAQGRLLMKLPVSNDAINVAGWAPGLYTVRLCDASGTVIGRERVAVVR